MFPEKWKSAEWHHPTECYVHEDGDDIRIGNSLVERVLSRKGGYLRSKAITNKRTGRTWQVAGNAEARLSFEAYLLAKRRRHLAVRARLACNGATLPMTRVSKQGFHRAELR